jgi:hypothetical protein
MEASSIWVAMMNEQKAKRAVILALEEWARAWAAAADELEFQGHQPFVPAHPELSSAMTVQEDNGLVAQLRAAETQAEELERRLVRLSDPLALAKWVYRLVTGEEWEKLSVEGKLAWLHSAEEFIAGHDQVGKGV